MSEHGFDRAYWDEHWRERGHVLPASPYLAVELGDLEPGTALDAGCGEGAEALWLADHGWQVTAVDISAEVLARARSRSGADRVAWLEADLSTWRPEAPFDLVTTHYAHPAMPQLDFYARIADWVALGGTLLVVGHLHGAGHGHGHPELATADAAGITALLADGWDVVTAAEQPREVPGGPTLHDVVVRAIRC